MKGIIIAGWTSSLINFRKAILQDLKAMGHDLIAMGPEEDVPTLEALSQMDIHFIRLPLERTGSSPWKDWQTIQFLKQTIQRTRPDFVFAYTIKPVVYGGIACRSFPKVRFHALISGLGFAFSEPTNFKQRAVQHISRWLYRRALNCADTVFFQNPEDRETFREKRLLFPKTRVEIVPGSGVPLEDYPWKPVPDSSDQVNFLFIGRLIRDKGVESFAGAARKVRNQFPSARFQILGPLDSNPSALSKAELEQWQEEGIVEYLGETRDVRPYLAAAHVFVLPSYYLEGIPRTLLEALSTGRPVITTQWRGCRETVKNPRPTEVPGLLQGDNGFLAEPRQAAPLEAAMKKFLTDPHLAEKMGKASRAYAEDRFDVRKVNAQMLKAMGF